MEPGASVGRGDMPTMAIRPGGVGAGAAHGIAAARVGSRDTNRHALREIMAASCQKLVPANSGRCRCIVNGDASEKEVQRPPES